jgi:hypothetical protein
MTLPNFLRYPEFQTGFGMLLDERKIAKAVLHHNRSGVHCKRIKKWRQK